MTDVAVRHPDRAAADGPAFWAGLARSREELAAATDEDRKQALKALEIADAMLSAAHGALH